MSFDLSASFPSLDKPNTANSSDTGTAPKPASYRINYVSGPCGSGKTHGAAQEIAKTIHERPTGSEPNYLYAGPSIKLLSEVAAILTSLGIDHRIISSETHLNMVTKELMAHLESLDDTGNVILCTHAAFFNMPYFPKPDQWTVIIDEIPQLDEPFSFPVTRSASLFADWFEVRPHNGTLSRVKRRKNKKNEIDKVLREDDAALDPFKKLLRKCRSPFYDIFTETASYDRIVNQRLVSEKSSENTLNFLAVLNPYALRDSTILAANFELSTLYDLLKRHGCELIEDLRIKNRLRDTEYDKRIGEMTKIYYCLEDQRYSKKLRAKTDIEGRVIKEVIDSTILDFIGDRRFLLLANKDDQGSLSKAKNLTLLPGSVSGLNCYDDHDLLVFLAALNPKPVHSRMLGGLGFNKVAIIHSMLIERVHQAIMRTALRNPHSSQGVEIIVADRFTALAVGKIIGCQKIERLGHIEIQQSVKKASPYTKAEKDRRYHLKKDRSALFSGQQGLRPSTYINKKGCQNHKDDTIESMSEDSEVSNDNHTPNGQRLLLTYHLHFGANSEEQHAIESYTPMGLVKHFEKLSKAPVDDKTEVYLFNTAIFEPTGENDGYRTQANFRASFALVLDFDNGALSPDNFERMFWHEAGSLRKHSFIICNTFSRSPEQPNRFRVIMPFKTPALTIKEYRAVYDATVERLQESGYGPDDTRLDKNARTGVQSFWIPCTNRAYREWAFFKAYGFKASEFERYAIDPIGYGLTQVESTRTRSYASRRKEATPEQLAEIENLADQIRGMKEGRNAPFFDLGVKMRSAGFSFDENMRRLLEVAGNDNKMKAKARDIIKRLKGYG